MPPLASTTDGSCVADLPECNSFDPCAGKPCGDLCSVCAPEDPDCIETQEIKVCNADGACSGDAPQCDTSEFDPCQGKDCGDFCTLCAPGDADCVETQVVKVCQQDGACSDLGDGHDRRS